jgi:hypothetical protein
MRADLSPKFNVSGASKRLPANMRERERERERERLYYKAGGKSREKLQIFFGPLLSYFSR